MILEKEYKKNIAMIDTTRARGLVDLLNMKKGDASVAFVENWWNSRYLLEKIKNTESFQTRGHSQIMLQSLIENFNYLTQSWVQLFRDNKVTVMIISYF